MPDFYKFYTVMNVLEKPTYFARKDYPIAVN